MNYFRYQYQGSFGEIWEVFHELRDAQEECNLTKEEYNRCEYSHTVNIINSMMNGSVFDRNNFSLRDYEFACQENDKVSRFNKSKREPAIINESCLDKDGGTKRAPNTVLESDLKIFEEAFERIINDNDLEESLKSLIRVRDDYIVEQGLDPVLVLKNALKGIPEAIKELKEVKDSKLKEIYLSLLESCSENTLISRLEALGGCGL